MVRPHAMSNLTFYTISLHIIIIVPSEPLRKHVLHWFHASLAGGHQGVNKTNKRMRKFVGWHGMM